MEFACPVCGLELVRAERVMRCAGGHCYDISRAGTVNLLRSQKSSKKRHGDDVLMLRARRDFLSHGHYDCIIQTVCDAAAAAAPPECVLLDVGCGECTYTARLYDRLRAEGCSACVMGVDISRDALTIGARLQPEMKLAVASAFSLPVADESCDIVLSVFAPSSPEEIDRVLRPGGAFIRVAPLPEHLMGLKRAIYEQPRENKPDVFDLPGFELTDERLMCATLELDSTEDIRSLFMMTPYYYKTGKADQQKVESLTGLVTQIEVAVRTYRRTKES